MTEYADRDAQALGEHYTRHISAMTEESLRDKADIAAELAWRDQQIYDLSCKVYYRDDKIAKLELQRGNREKRIAELQRQIKDLNTQIEGLHLLLMSRDVCLSEIQESLTEQTLAARQDLLPERFRPALDAYAARLREEQAKHLATLQRKLDPE